LAAALVVSVEGTPSASLAAEALFAPVPPMKIETFCVI
jgi:hypothetical protein